jgi:hypothetical protein
LKKKYFAKPEVYGSNLDIQASEKAVQPAAIKRRPNRDSDCAEIDQLADPIFGAMTRKRFRLLRNFAVALLPLVVIGAALTPAFGQSGSQRPGIFDPEDKNENKSFHSIEEEMKTKRALKYAEKEYQENLDRARDLSTLGAAIVTAYGEKRALDHEDLKKLDKIEKLAKGIRSAAGGSDDDTAMEKPPADMADAVKMLGTTSHSLKEEVQKTPKRVISAIVIDQANVLLELVRIVRSLPSKV